MQFENVLGAESASRGEVVVPVMTDRWQHCCEMNGEDSIFVTRVYEVVFRKNIRKSPNARARV